MVYVEQNTIAHHKTIHYKHKRLHWKLTVMTGYACFTLHKIQGHLNSLV